MIKITIDTMLINFWRGLNEINFLEALNDDGLIKIVGTDRLLQETVGHFGQHSKAKSYENVGEPFTIGFSRIGYAYVSDGKPRPTFSELSSILFPDVDSSKLTTNQSNDVMHLIAHSRSDSKYFVTKNTKDFIDAKRDNKNRNGTYKNYKREKLEKLGIWVFTPDEILEVLEKEHGIK